MIINTSRQEYEKLIEKRKVQKTHQWGIRFETGIPRAGYLLLKYVLPYRLRNDEKNEYDLSFGENYTVQFQTQAAGHKSDKDPNL